MSVKEFFSKYKLYTILAVVVAVLVAGGVTLGVLLSRDTTPPADAVTGDVYIMADGTVTSADNYDFALDIYYSSASATVCRLDRVTRNANSTVTTIVIPETITINGTARTITTMNSGGPGNAVFYPVRSFITEVSLPDTITNIGSSAFYSCSGLTSITIPSSVTRIGEDAFSFCSSLTSINIPNSVTNIGSSAFFNCSSLIAIEVYGKNPNYKDDNGVLYTKNGTALIVCPEGTTITEYNILDTTTIIDDNAFRYCSSLTSITIPSSVTSIGSSAFNDCTSLTSINIPDSVTRIRKHAFQGCSSLSSSIIIPDGVTSIGEYTFSGCSSLPSITIPDSVTSIGERAFQYCSSLTSVNIPSSVTSIESYAFDYCSSLTDVYFYNDITSDTSMIGTYAFYHNNSNVTYWFKDQTSLDNAIAIDTASTNKFTGLSDHSNFKLMEWNVSVNCNENFGTLSYTEPTSLTYGTEITATVTPNGSAEFLYWEVYYYQGGTLKSSEQITDTTLNYTITEFGNYIFNAVFDIDLFITSESGGVEFDIIRETNDGIVYTYSIKMKDGYSLDRIALIATDATISSTDYQDAPATENYLNTNGFCTGFHYIVNDNGTELILEIVNITAPFIVYLGF